MKVVQSGYHATYHVLLLAFFVALTSSPLLNPLPGFADESLDAPDFPALPPQKSNKLINYPEHAKRDGLEGKVLVAFDITDGGHVANVTINSISHGISFLHCAKQLESAFRCSCVGCSYQH